MNLNDIDIEKLALNLGYSYIKTGCGKWEDSSGDIHNIKSMDKKYKKYCKNFINRHIGEIKGGDVDRDIKDKLRQLYDDDILISKTELKELKKKLIRTLKLKTDEFKS